MQKLIVGTFHSLCLNTYDPCNFFIRGILDNQVALCVMSWME